ncbi:hypothetical protein MMC11_007976 [Xylographa trunciseda]|nr:hypothetical protein [Xylographa trunciseda]
MAENTDTPLHNIQPPLQAQTFRQLVPNPAATFKGSFAPGNRQEDRLLPSKVGTAELIQLYFTEGWRDPAIYKSAFIEMFGTMTLIYLSALIDTTIGNFGTRQAPTYAGVTNVILLSLLIYAISSSSGGHVNPLITFTTVTTGLTPLPRGVVYMIAQTVGGAIAGGLIRGSFGYEMTQEIHGGGCFIDTDQISIGQAFIIEATSCFILTFLAFGVGLDPRQAELYGQLGPFLVGTALGLVSFASAGVIPGYPGASMNPARCFGMAVARDGFQDQWLWWVGPLAGSLVQTAVYHAVPPYHTRAK